MPPRLRSRLPARPFSRALQSFLGTEAKSGILLVGAAAVALVWSNAPWSETYDDLWSTGIDLRAGPFGIDADLHHLVNDGLMALFFLVVGLEIKRELVVGELREVRAAVLPALAAVGGMVVPALCYVAFNAGQPGADGWGIPMATDIAFALGVLLLLGDRVPASMKLFLLSLAVVDDVGAIVVIAVFYSGDVSEVGLGLALAAIAGSLLLRRLGVHWAGVHVVLGLLCWQATYESGVHATIAGVAFGLATPVRPRRPDGASPAERVEQLLHPFTSYLVVPVFALANAGVALSAGAFDDQGARRAAIGIAAGLVVGKFAGVLGATALAVRLGVSGLPAGSDWGHVAGVAALAGIGFTVSLFVSGLAFDDAALLDAATMAVLGASLVASLLGAVLLVVRARA